MAQWYITLAGVELGPIGDDQLRRLAVEGRLRPDDRVRRSGMMHTVEAARIGGLFGCRSELAHQPDAGSLTTFSAWYRQHPGRWPFWAQLLAWLLYGFLWVPGWWALDLMCSQEEEVRRFGRRVLETVGCITIIVIVAITLREKQLERGELSMERQVPSKTTSTAHASQ